MFISKEVKELIEDIKVNHKDWVPNSHTIRNERTKLEIWTANGVLFIDFHIGIKVFNIFEKIAVHKAVKIAIIKNAIIKE